VNLSVSNSYEVMQPIEKLLHLIEDLIVERVALLRTVQQQPDDLSLLLLSHEPVSLLLHIDALNLSDIYLIGIADCNDNSGFHLYNKILY